MAKFKDDIAREAIGKKKEKKKKKESKERKPSGEKKPVEKQKKRYPSEVARERIKSRDRISSQDGTTSRDRITSEKERKRLPSKDKSVRNRIPSEEKSDKKKRKKLKKSSENLEIHQEVRNSPDPVDEKTKSRRVSTPTPEDPTINNCLHNQSTEDPFSLDKLNSLYEEADDILVAAGYEKMFPGNSKLKSNDVNNDREDSPIDTPSNTSLGQMDEVSDELIGRSTVSLPGFIMNQFYRNVLPLSSNFTTINLRLRA